MVTARYYNHGTNDPPRLALFIVYLVSSVVHQCVMADIGSYVRRLASKGAGWYGVIKYYVRRGRVTSRQLFDIIVHRRRRSDKDQEM